MSSFTVLQAASEASALKALDELAARTPPVRVNLAFVDYELPDGTGLAILERLKTCPNTIRVLMSGNLERIAEFRQCGSLVPLVLAKPLKQASIDAAKRAALAVLD
jgi:CheY-like chemotaxis protein